MAKLYYDPWLTLNLQEAAERQRNKEPFVLGSTVPVTKDFYDRMYTRVFSKRKFRKALSQITKQKLMDVWTELYGPKFDGVFFPASNARTTPCIKEVTEESTIIAIPFYIEGALASQVETVLKKCLKNYDGYFVCVGNEIRLELFL